MIRLSVRKNHLGVRDVYVITNEGQPCVMRMQVTNVTKALMSVSNICDSGHRVVFEKDGGYIEHLTSGATTRFQRRNNVYQIRLQLALDEISDFDGPASRT